MDLENRTTQTIDMGNAIAVKLDNYFHGKYLAIGRTFRRGSEHSGKMQIQIYDIEAGANKIIYDKMKHEGDWCIADDRVSIFHPPTRRTTIFRSRLRIKILRIF